MSAAEPTAAEIEAARQAYLASERQRRRAKRTVIRRKTSTLSYKQRRAVWSAMTARNRAEAIAAMELYVSPDEAEQLQRESEQPLEIPPSPPGPHPVDVLMGRLKASMR